MNRLTLDLWVGFFVAIGLASLVFLALKVGNLSGSSMSDTYRLEAKFDNIGVSPRSGSTRKAMSPWSACR